MLCCALCEHSYVFTAIDHQQPTMLDPCASLCRGESELFVRSHLYTSEVLKMNSLINVCMMDS